MFLFFFYINVSHLDTIQPFSLNKHIKPVIYLQIHVKYKVYRHLQHVKYLFPSFPIERTYTMSPILQHYFPGVSYSYIVISSICPPLLIISQGLEDIVQINYGSSAFQSVIRRSLIVPPTNSFLKINLRMEFILIAQASKQVWEEWL